MAKTHTVSDGRTVVHQHGDYAAAAALAATLDNSKKTVTPTSP